MYWLIYIIKQIVKYWNIFFRLNRTVNFSIHYFYLVDSLISGKYESKRVHKKCLRFWEWVFFSTRPKIIWKLQPWQKPTQFCCVNLSDVDPDSFGSVDSDPEEQTEGRHYYRNSPDKSLFQRCRLKYIFFIDKFVIWWFYWPGPDPHPILLIRLHMTGQPASDV